MRVYVYVYFLFCVYSCTWVCVCTSLLNLVMQCLCFQYISCECTHAQCQGELQDINVITCADDNTELQHKFAGFSIPILRQASIEDV